ncbi:ER lumen protein retaining [Musa troglodytarum]|uniref:ER lumen protein retaining n=1 Tax=Musa troglodytarum TaxID=320322 RepID=A0A9E7E8I9_9LILI|nr:ER lumen protein retaining [Musa troglodytarum]
MHIATLSRSASCRCDVNAPHRFFKVVFPAFIPPSHSVDQRLLFSFSGIGLLEREREMDSKTRKGRVRPIRAVVGWVRRRSPKVKASLSVIAGMAALVFLRFIVHDHDKLFVVAEAAHALGISVLIYKLIKERTCAGAPSLPSPSMPLPFLFDPCDLEAGFSLKLGGGLSLKTQYLTALFLAVRLYCSFVMEYDIHTVLDCATLATTLWVIYMICFKLESSYMKEKDNFSIYYVVLPCAILAFSVHPSTTHNIIDRISWAFCVYLEAVSVLPQLRLMQNTKIVEPFTAHYVFALGVSRFLSCAHWVLKVLDTRGRLLTALGHGLWPPLFLLAEIVQTFILADFCYYYVKSVVGGQLVLRLPSGVV